MASKYLSLSAIAVAGLLSACANGAGGPSSLFTTASLPEPPKVDPACAPLSQQIESLKRDGVADKVTKAAAKSYKMTAADLSKADQLNKANAEFQTKCSTVPKAAAPQAAAPLPAEATKTAQVASATKARTVTAPAKSVQPVAVGAGAGNN